MSDATAPAPHATSTDLASHVTQEIVHELVERFERNRSQYRTPSYNETQVRREFIEVFYNRIRRHSALDYVSPAEFELAQVA